MSLCADSLVICDYGTENGSMGYAFPHAAETTPCPPSPRQRSDRAARRPPAASAAHAAAGPRAADLRAASSGQEVVLVRVHAAQNAAGGAAAVARHQAARAAETDLRLGDIRSRRLYQGPDGPGDRQDRRAHVADPGGPPYRGQPLR